MTIEIITNSKKLVMTESKVDTEFGRLRRPELA